MDYLLLVLFRNGFVGFVVEAVQPPDFVGRPDAIVVEVVEDEEGCGVEVVDMMFLWGGLARRMSRQN